MLGEGGTPLTELEAAIRGLQSCVPDIDPKRLRAAIDALEGVFSAVVKRARERGDHLVNGNITAASWISRTCGMSVTSAADRLCVGEQLQSLPKVAAALSSGEIGYQSTSVLCHLREQLGEKRDLFDEEEMLDFARRFSVFHLRMLSRVARHVADPDGFFNEAEENYLRRRLHVSLMADGMHAIDGILDPECGAALRRRWTPWPRAGVRKTSGPIPSGCTMRWASWSSTPWTRAGCRGATGSGRTST